MTKPTELYVVEEIEIKDPVISRPFPEHPEIVNLESFSMFVCYRTPSGNVETKILSLSQDDLDKLSEQILGLMEYKHKLANPPSSIN